MNILIDMDGVICTEEKTFERALARPLPGARESLQRLRDAGHQIIIYTARSWSELAMTKHWLEAHGMPYDGLHMGKPVADRIVDDRAVPFSGWPAALEALARQGRPDVDHVYRQILDEATARLLRRIADMPQLRGSILECGPGLSAGPDGPPGGAGPLDAFDLRAALAARGLKVLRLDADAATQPDLGCDFLQAERHLPAASLGGVVMISCLQRMPDLFDVPGVLERLLAPGGYGFFLTPWNVALPGSQPDCWRLSGEGYRALFDKRFEIVEIEPIACPGRPQSPIGIQCIVRKKGMAQPRQRHGGP